MDCITISTVTPVYNGAKYLPQLIDELSKQRAYIEKQTKQLRLIECIFVIDECKDNSREILYNIAQELEWIKILELSKNFGQHPATIAGILHSSGNWIVTLDEDMQHRPSHILTLLDKVVSDNSDVCYANPLENIHNSIVRDKLSILFKKIIGFLSGSDRIGDINSFRVIRGNVARAAAALASYETYYDISLSWFTKRISVIKVAMTDERNQNSEESGYSLFSLIRHGKRMIMSSRIKPLRIGIFIGSFSFILSIVLAIITLSAKLFDLTILPHGWSSLMLVVLFFGGLLSFLVGFVLESVSEILLSVKGKPTFFVVDRTKDVLLKEILKDIK